MERVQKCTFWIMTIDIYDIFMKANEFFQDANIAMLFRANHFKWEGLWQDICLYSRFSIRLSFEKNS